MPPEVRKQAQRAAGKSITPTCNNLLIVRKDLGLDRNTIV